MHNPIDRIAHTTAFVTPVVENWLQREIAQLVLQRPWYFIILSVMVHIKDPLLLIKKVVNEVLVVGFLSF